MRRVCLVISQPQTASGNTALVAAVTMLTFKAHTFNQPYVCLRNVAHRACSGKGGSVDAYNAA